MSDFYAETRAVVESTASCGDKLGLDLVQGF